MTAQWIHRVWAGGFCLLCVTSLQAGTIKTMSTRKVTRDIDQKRDACMKACSATDAGCKVSCKSKRAASMKCVRMQRTAQKDPKWKERLKRKYGMSVASDVLVKEKQSAGEKDTPLDATFQNCMRKVREKYGD